LSQVKELSVLQELFSCAQGREKAQGVHNNALALKRITDLYVGYFEIYKLAKRVASTGTD